MENFNIQAEKRHSSGTGAARALRKSGLMPVIVYGAGRELMLSMESTKFLKQYSSGALSSRAGTITTDKETIKVILRDAHFHPVTDLPVHADFQEIRKGVPIKISARIKILNEDRCPGLKRGGILNVAKRSVQIYCCPDNMPEYLIVDIMDLNIGRSIHAKDISLPEDVTFIDKTNFVVLSMGGRDSDSAVKADAPPEGSTG